jgi:hypothetical protein
MSRPRKNDADKKKKVSFTINPLIHIKEEEIDKNN